MAGIDRLSGSIQRQVQTGLGNGTISQDQANKLTGDLSNLQQAFASGDPGAVRTAFQQLHGDAEQSGIELPRPPGPREGLQMLMQAAQAGDPQAQQIVQQLQQLAQAAQAGDPQAKAMLGALLPPGAGSAAQAAGGNPYMSFSDTFRR